MPATEEASRSLVSYVDLEARTLARHPLRKIRQVESDVLTSMDGEFESFYTNFRRPSVSPGVLIRTRLMQVPFSFRSQRQLAGLCI